jgi:hypothetical protein
MLVSARSLRSHQPHKATLKARDVVVGPMAYRAGDASAPKTSLDQPLNGF